MDEPIDAPKPPSDLSEDVTEVVDQLPPQELRSLIKYAGARFRHLETPISELIEVGEGEELVRVEDNNVEAEGMNWPPIKKPCCDEHQSNRPEGQKHPKASGLCESDPRRSDDERDGYESDGIEKPEDIDTQERT